MAWRSMNLSFSSLSQYCAQTNVVQSHGEEVEERAGKVHEAHLGTDGTSAAWFVVEDEETLLLFSFRRSTSKYARDGGATAEKGGVAREVDVGVDVDEQSMWGHGRFGDRAMDPTFAAVMSVSREKGWVRGSGGAREEEGKEGGRKASGNGTVAAT